MNYELGRTGEVKSVTNIELLNILQGWAMALIVQREDNADAESYNSIKDIPFKLIFTILSREIPKIDLALIFRSTGWYPVMFEDVHAVPDIMPITYPYFILTVPLPFPIVSNDKDW